MTTKEDIAFKNFFERNKKYKERIIKSLKVWKQKFKDNDNKSIIVNLNECSCDKIEHALDTKDYKFLHRFFYTKKIVADAIQPLEKDDLNMYRTKKR